MSNTIQDSLAPAPLPARTQRESDLAAAVANSNSPSSAQRFGFWFVLAFVFIVYGRVPELITMQLKVSIPFVMVISIIAALAALFALDLRLLARMPAVLWLVAFTGWLVVTGLFSTWHGGTLQMFTEYWSKAILNCVVIAILVVTLDQIRKIMYAVAFATLVVIGAGFFWSGSVLGRMEIFAGTASSLSNPNELASRLLSGLCFCLFILSYERGFSVKKVILGLAIPVLLVMAIRTGSRSGLITMGVLLLMVFLRASLNQKIMMFATAAAAAFLMLAFLPKDIVDRYAVMFSDSEAGLTEDQIIAIHSGTARRQLMEEGIGLAFQHPLFGVGPGVYAAAAAGQAKEEGRRASWHETHNTYVQIAAENGLPGIFLYGAAILYCLKKSFRLYRQTRNRPDLENLSKMAFCLLLANVSWVLGAFFDSQAYRLEFPLLAALTCAFVLAAEPRINQALAVIPVRIDTSRPILQPQSPRLTPQPPVPVNSAAAAKPAPVKPNPVRFGRMRNP